jgi:hypothetical protein
MMFNGHFPLINLHTLSQIITPVALPSFGISGPVDVMLANTVNAHDVLGATSALPFLASF